nr:WYL domain-containing protein [Phytoactinopolyspora limicola]
MAIADACRRHEGLRFDYTSPRGGDSIRAVEPHRLVNFGRHWYLVAFDTDRNDWRTFRVDRLSLRIPTGPRFSPRVPPFDDVAAYLAHQLSVRTWPCQATVTLHESAENMAGRVWPGMGVLEAVDDHSCRLHLGADSISSLVWMITSVDADFTLVDGPPELVDALRRRADRCRRAVADGDQSNTCSSLSP